jgi:hypothetical protein
MRSTIPAIPLMALGRNISGCRNKLNKFSEEKMVATSKALAVSRYVMKASTAEIDGIEKATARLQMVNFV